MSGHEKERNKKMPTPRHKLIHNPIPTSLFLPRQQHTSCRQLDVFVLCPNAKQRCRDGVMNDFVSPFILLYLTYTFIHTCTREERVLSVCACVCVNKVHTHMGWGKEPEQNITFFMGLCPKIKNEWNKCEKSNEGGCRDVTS